jgi:thiamine biosynthesis lipoprotein
MLGEWGIDTVMISAGQSTILPIGIPAGLTGWPVTLSNPVDNKIMTKLFLTGRALSASGLQKGLHIINPRNGKPAKRKLACWATAQTAAVADALSTAFMVMSLDEIRTYCKTHAETSSLIIKSNKKRDFVRLGRWSEIEKI